MSLGLTATMKWWEEWQLRILVLGSLLIQFILLLTGLLRRTRYRSIIWLAYVVGDALATLFSRQKLHKTDAGVKASSLEVIWVPVLLVHLGVQPTISAYSLEDNELWRRHVLTLVTQVAVAIYSFYKWWFGDVKLLVAAILLFILVLGIIKYAAKPWALRNASFAKLQAVSSSLSRRKKQGVVVAWWTWCTSMYAGEGVNNNRREGRQECESLEEFVLEATKAVQEEFGKRMKAVREKDIEAADSNQEVLNHSDWILISKAINAVEEVVAGWDEISGVSGFYHTNYFVDVIAPYSVRLRELRSFVKLGHLQQLNRLKRYIIAKGTTMYSTIRTVVTPLGSFLHIILFPCLAIASVVLFAFSRKDGYSVKDISVTYILLSYNCFMELYLTMFIMPAVIRNLLIRNGFVRPYHTGQVGNRTPRRQGFVFQYSLLSYYSRKKEPTFVMKLAIFDFLRDIANKRWYIGEVQTAYHIRFRVLRHVILGWYKHIQGDAARYKRFNNLKGQMVLNKHEQMAKTGWSVRTRFDESVLLCHIATDLCFHCHDRSPQGAGGAEATTRSGEQDIQVTRSISNYMI